MIFPFSSMMFSSFSHEHGHFIFRSKVKSTLQAWSRTSRACAFGETCTLAKNDHENIEDFYGFVQNVGVKSIWIWFYFMCFFPPFIFSNVFWIISLDGFCFWRWPSFGPLVSHLWPFDASGRHVDGSVAHGRATKNTMGQWGDANLVYWCLLGIMYKPTIGLFTIYKQ